MEIRQLPANEYDKALDLSLDVFIECGRKDFDEEGLETFKNFIYNKQLVNELTFYGAFDWRNRDKKRGKTYLLILYQTVLS